MKGFPFLLCEQAYRLGALRWINIDFDAGAHYLIAGRTGSGLL